MKKAIYFLPLVLSIIFFNACKKKDGSPAPITPVIEKIVLSSNDTNVFTGATVTFSVNSSVNNNVTSTSKIFVNGILITANNYVFANEGTYTVYAKKDTLVSNTLLIRVNAPAFQGFVDRVLVEEFSGTWCGNCPAILFGVDSLHKQTNKAIVVGTHLFNADPFITLQGNSLATSLSVSSVPTGLINRTTSWSSPQYQHVNQVTNQVQTIETIGLAISSTVASSTLNTTIKVSYKQALSSNAKLTVYLVEDKLHHTQSNYFSSLYGGQANIPNFEYNGVLRAVISNLVGDAIANSGSSVEKIYTLALGSKVANIANARIVAFVTDATGKVINAQEAAVGTTKDFEKL